VFVVDRHVHVDEVPSRHLAAAGAATDRLTIRNSLRISKIVAFPASAGDSMSKAFASQADLDDKKITFEQLSAHCWAYTAEGDPNSGVIIGDQFVMVSDATATPAMAQDSHRAASGTVSHKPIKYVLLTHYHAVRVLGASAYAAEGASRNHRQPGHAGADRRARQGRHAVGDGRFPRLFRNAGKRAG
jgi:glyoxylase-like metal-dependent hydrolase (beta-lactamase superfamily II)